jgi:hypothetical protein
MIDANFLTLAESIFIAKPSNGNILFWPISLIFCTQDATFFQDLFLLINECPMYTPFFGAVCDSLIEDVKQIVKHLNPVSSLLITKKTSQCRSCGVWNLLGNT